jgi:diguanylate cyclase (GGDEF)-like protein/PAS domain S-box-containing protein
MKNDYVMKILFIENSVEEAEQIISQLRNSGIAVRPARATNAEQLEAAINELEPDIVMFDPNVAGLSVTDVRATMDTSGRDYSLLGLVSKFDNDMITNLFVGGVRGIASRSSPRQLISVLSREFDSLQTRRKVRSLEASLRESERRCDALLDSSTDAIAYVHEGMHVRVNQAYLDTFGYASFDDLMGVPVLDMINPGHADEFKALLRGHARQERLASHATLHARRADGSHFDATVEFAAATFEGEPCLQIVFRQQELDPALLQQLQRDAVTGLLNRARILERIDDAVGAAAKGKKGQALLLVEPDNWTSTVTGIGMGKTDELLASFAERVRSLLGPEDVAGMLGDHTVGIVLDSRQDNAIRDWIEQLQKSVSSEIFDAGTRSITVTASIGGSLLGEKNANTELLLNQASQALRNAQNIGGGNVELHDPAAREKADDERDKYWLSLLRKALVEDGLMLYHQQTISLQDVDGDYSEILLRMNGPQGTVLPGFFMPLAEKHGLNAMVDRWVLEHTINALRARDAQGQKTTYFVKLTATSLQDTTLMSWLGTQMQKAALKQGRLVLEMTESKVMTLLRPAQQFVNAWKELGGQFALEQFGSGLNSFHLLNHIDADYLKLDRSYVADLPTHPENQKKIAEICQQARELKRMTIAEWVEDANSTSLLFSCGVDFVQGNFLQEPELLPPAPAYP